MEKIELSVQSFSEIPSDIQNIFKNRNTSALQYNHMLYVLAGDKVYSCADSPEGKSLISQISTVFSVSIYSEKDIWKSAIEGFKPLQNRSLVISVFLPCEGQAGNAVDFIRRITETEHVVEEEVVQFVRSH